MVIFPAIDIYEGKAVRLYKGDYDQMTIYNDNPVEVAKAFREAGATHIHIVDLEGAKTGLVPNIRTVRAIAEESGLFCEIGGGIRTIEMVHRYFDAGIGRVILGTAAVTDPDLLRAALSLYGAGIAVGADIRDGEIAVKGWTQSSGTTSVAFFDMLESLGVSHVICTDISKDGAMEGTNRSLYAEMAKKYTFQITASGGISNLEDVRALKEMGLYGAIIGKAYYTGAMDLAEAIEVAK